MYRQLKTISQWSYWVEKRKQLATEAVGSDWDWPAEGCYEQLVISYICGNILIFLKKPDNLDFYRNTTNPWSISSSQVWYLVATNSSKVVQAALCAKHCSSTLHALVLLILMVTMEDRYYHPLFSIWGKWNSEMLGNLTKVTQIGNGPRQSSPELVL